MLFICSNLWVMGIVDLFMLHWRKLKSEILTSPPMVNDLHHSSNAFSALPDILPLFTRIFFLILTTRFFQPTYSTNNLKNLKNEKNRFRRYAKLNLMFVPQYRQLHTLIKFLCELLKLQFTFKSPINFFYFISTRPHPT